ncbi:MAG: dihydroorotate dehydrogenase electron transfer subunit [Clostridia bacterium]
MNNAIFKIANNVQIAEKIFKITLYGDTSAIVRSGQFVNIKINGFFLRRPISICDYGDGKLVLIYKTVGKGTDALSLMKSGESLDLLCGLGNGYNTETSGSAPLLIGGGAGVPPLFNLCKKLILEKKSVSVILGFNTKSEVYFEKEFEELTKNVFVTTVDGSYGTKGFVTDILSKINKFSYIYTCGPEPMLKAIYNNSETSGQYSFESRMGCGFGVCMGCSCKTKYGNKRICKDGPVLEKEEIIW